MGSRLSVSAIAAISLDGRITRHDEPGTDFTSPEDKAWFVGFLSSFDCSICGRNTYEASRGFILERLNPERRRIVMTRKPCEFSSDEVPGSLEFRSGTGESTVNYLESCGHKNCALLGGGELYTTFFQENLVDEIWLTLEPVVFGKGRPFVEGVTLDNCYSLQSVQRLGDSGTLLIHYLRKD